VFFIIKAAAVGAAIGGVVAAATGGDIVNGLITGAIGGALFAGVSSLAQAAMKFALTGTTQVSLIGGARAAANIVSSVVGGAAAGAATAAYSGTDTGKGALIGAAVAGTFAVISETASYMRNKMVQQSRSDHRNSSGKSAGWKGDRFKLAGNRRSLDPYKALHDKPSPLGGLQGEQGKFFGIDYSPGSILDHTVEAYAGPHDFLNSWAYDSATGNIRNLNLFEKFIGTFTNPLNVAIATPIAVPSTLPPIMVVPPVIIYGQSHWDEDGQAVLNE